jgi:hypothetical protein
MFYLDILCHHEVLHVCYKCDEKHDTSQKYLTQDVMLSFYFMFEWDCEACEAWQWNEVLEAVVL